MAFEIRTIDADEVEAYLTAANRGFYRNRVEPERLSLRQRVYEAGRVWAAIERGVIVGTLRSARFATTLPGGGTAPTSGVTDVSVASTHRRQGVMARMLTAELRAARDRGEPITSLIAAEWPIYGRFGYGPATDYVEYTMDANATFTNEGDGRVELVDVATLRAHAPAVYDLHRLANVSEIGRDDAWWDLICHVIVYEPWKGFQVLCRDDNGAPTGYAIYSLEDKWDGRRPASVVTVDEMIAATPGAEARLWRYLCELDWVTSIKLETRRVDEPVRHWIVDGRMLTQTARTDFVWARPLDVEACLTARTYATAGCVAIEVTDPAGLATSSSKPGRFLLDADGSGKATCALTDTRGDVTMPMFALGAIVYGGTSLCDLAAGGLVDEHTSGAVDRADRMFRTTPAPWSVTWF